MKSNLMTEAKSFTTTDEEVAVALAELQVEGLIEYDDELRFRLTPKGLDYAEKLVYAHQPKERVAMFMYTAGADNIGEALQGDSK